MNDLTIRPAMPSRQFGTQYEAEALLVELTKILALVAPSTMTTEQQKNWLAAAVDAMEDIRAEEVRHVSAQVRRTVKRHTEIVPEIAKLVAARREERAKPSRCEFPLPELPPRQPGPALDADEIAAMPKWLRDMGLRIGFLRRDGDRIVDAGR